MQWLANWAHSASIVYINSLLISCSGTLMYQVPHSLISIGCPWRFSKLSSPITGKGDLGGGEFPIICCFHALLSCLLGLGKESNVTREGKRGSSDFSLFSVGLCLKLQDWSHALEPGTSIFRKVQFNTHKPACINITLYVLLFFHFSGIDYISPQVGSPSFP